MQIFKGVRQVYQGFPKVLVGQSCLQELILTTVPRRQDASFLVRGLKLLQVRHILAHGVLLVSIFLHDDFHAFLIIDHLCLTSRIACKSIQLLLDDIWEVILVLGLQVNAINAAVLRYLGFSSWARGPSREESDGAQTPLLRDLHSVLSLFEGVHVLEVSQF